MTVDGMIRVHPEHPERTLTADELEQCRRIVKERLGLGSEEEPDPLIDLVLIAKLADVATNTPGQWQQRSKAGEMEEPFPEPDDLRYHDKKQWRAIGSVCWWLIETYRWPPGTVGRPNTRARAPRSRRRAAA